MNIDIYERAYKNMEFTKEALKNQEFIKRFKSNFTEENGCWNWKGVISSQGYGRFQYERRYLKESFGIIKMGEWLK